MQRSQAAVHTQVREVAEGMAQVCYEQLARNDAWYKNHPDRNKYVAHVWPMLIDEARATLARMLQGPYNEGLKAKVAEALILDRQLRRTPKRLIWRQ